MIRAYAPGKMLLIGEYAVLEGCDALVFAVDRQAEVSVEKVSGNEYSVLSPSLGILESQPFILNPNGKLYFDPNINPFTGRKLLFFQKLVEFFTSHIALTPLPALHINLQTDAFYSAEWRRKLGFGSSSALTVALFKALDEAWKLRQSPEQLFRLALAAHRFAQGNSGSGIDVAASFAGQVVRYKMNSGDAWQQTLPQAVTPWHDLPMAVVWSGTSASTKEMVASVSRLKTTNALLYRNLMETLCADSSAVIQAYAQQDLEAFLRFTAKFRDALRQLGSQSGTPIFTRAHEELVQLADKWQCVYKPSGAGGGDIGILFAPDAQKLAETERQIQKHGYRTIPVHMATDGVHFIKESN